MLKKYRNFKLLLSMIFTISLTSCSTTNTSVQNNSPPTGDAVSSHSQSSLRYKLNNSSVQVIQVGDKLLLELPADTCFNFNAPSFKATCYPILDNIVAYLNQYEKVTVNVAGYTDETGNASRNLALSRARAQYIANYLWDHGLDVRLLKSTGFGEEKAISSNTTASGRAANRRIEITTIRVPPVE